MDVVTLLRSKNRCLERFLELSEDFLRPAEQGDLSALPSFEARREATLKAYQLFDRKASEAISALTPADRTPELVEAVSAALRRKEELVHRILDVDLRIISRIEQAKNDLLKELALSRRNQAAVGRFKSTWMPESGEGLDEKL
jgi:hypothetical protein